MKSYPCQWSSFYSTKEGISFWQDPAGCLLELLVVQSLFLITMCRALSGDKYFEMHRVTWYFLVEYQAYPFRDTNLIIHSLSNKDFFYKLDLFDNPFHVLTCLACCYSCSFLDNNLIWWFVMPAGGSDRCMDKWSFSMFPLMMQKSHGLQNLCFPWLDILCKSLLSVVSKKANTERNNAN